jgi:hypothetical protein
MPAKANGKAKFTAPDGEPLPAKKIRGLCMGGAIRLTEPAPVLVIGEGIETTLTVLQALRERGRNPGDYAAWCAVSLGNIAGGHLGPSERHPDGAGWVPSGIPDPDRPALMPPDWAGRVILLGDGDSEPLATRAQLECARGRWEKAGVPTEIRFAPQGCDFNDLVRTGSDERRAA